MTKETPKALTKTCLICGIQKPLSAFLHFDPASGASYGAVCAPCRKTHPDGKKRKIEVEGSTTSETGHTIDSKSKLHSDIDKREQKKQVDERYHEDREKEALVDTQKNEKVEAIATDAKKHRQHFLDKKPVGKGDKTNAQKEKAQSFKFAQEATETSAKQTAENETAENKDQLAKSEKKLSEVDFSVPFLAPAVSGQIKFQGQTFQQFRKWLGNSAPIVSNLEKAAGDVKPNQPALTGDKPTNEPAPSDDKNPRPQGGRKR